MYNDISKPPPPLPRPELTALASGASLLRPLSRRGVGPGLVVLTPEQPDPLAIHDGVPAPLVKWAEEGYAVVGIPATALLPSTGSADDVVLQSALDALRRDDARCAPLDQVGLVAYGPDLWKAIAPALAAHSSSAAAAAAAAVVAAAVVYADASDGETSDDNDEVGIPVLRHLAGARPSASPPNQNTTTRPRPGSKTYWYAGARSYRFATPFQADFDYHAESLSHTRSLSFLKAAMGGPHFDLEAVWEEHTWYEFADRSMEHTMSTMVAEPYVNHVPTLTGGVGRDKLSSFYRHNFIFNNSADTELELISRTLGIDRIVDEFIFKFTHDRELDWLLPGVPPTHKKAEVPFSAVVNVRGDRLYHEHISWDQGTVLRQLGLLPEYLPFPYALPDDDDDDGTTGTAAPRREYRVPVLGIETARKMRDRNSVPSNGMFQYTVREAVAGEEEEDRPRPG